MIFARLRLIDDRVPGSGAWNMAADEAVLRAVKIPTLRVYRWAEPTVSLGYFEHWREARRLRPGWPLIRRWTGGGLVEHGRDFTYSLMISADHELAAGPREESYLAIHRAIQKMARTLGGVSLDLTETPALTGDGCFARPVKGDLLLAGRKVAGAAQRRTREGLLHQGSIQLDWLGAPSQATAFAGAFSENVQPDGLSAAERSEAARLVEKRYGQAAWLERF